MLTKNTANPEYCVIPIPSTTEVSCACAGARWALWPPACTACRVVWPVLLRVLSALPARLGSVALGGGQTPCPTPISCSSVARGRAPRPSPLLATARAGVRKAAPRPARRTEGEALIEVEVCVTLTGQKLRRVLARPQPAIIVSRKPTRHGPDDAYARPRACCRHAFY